MKNSSGGAERYWNKSAEEMFLMKTFSRKVEEIISQNIRGVSLNFVFIIQCQKSYKFLNKKRVSISLCAVNQSLGKLKNTENELYLLQHLFPTVLFGQTKVDFLFIECCSENFLVTVLVSRITEGIYIMFDIVCTKTQGSFEIVRGFFWQTSSTSLIILLQYVTMTTRPFWYLEKN